MDLDAFFISVAMCIVRTLCVMVKMAYHVPLGITLVSVDICTFGRVDLAKSTACRCGTISGRIFDKF